MCDNVVFVDSVMVAVRQDNPVDRTQNCYVFFLGGHIVKYMIVRGYHNVRVRVKN